MRAEGEPSAAAASSTGGGAEEPAPAWTLGNGRESAEGMVGLMGAAAATVVVVLGVAAGVEGRLPAGLRDVACKPLRCVRASAESFLQSLIK